jgi:hypothetical protein
MLDSLIKPKQPKTAAPAETRLEDLPGDESFDPFQSESPFSTVLTKIREADLPGVSLNLAELTPDSPVFGNFASNPRAMAKTGLGFYANKETGVGAVFNPAVFSREEIGKIDAAGKLPEVLPPVASLLESGQPTETPAAASGQPAMTSTPAPRARASEITPITQQRAQAPKARGPSPSGGSILNSLLKKPV